MEIRDYKYILIPNILAKYQCSASGECCKDKWRIDIDEDSYLKTKTNLDNLNEDINTYIEKVDNSYITKFSRGYCKFITEEKLCRIHRDFGWECLSNTCKVYPRNLKLTSRGLEISLVFSCSSAAKLLLSKEKFEIIKIRKEEFFLMKPNNISFLIPENNIKTNISSKYYELENLLINILNSEENLGKKLQYIDTTLKTILSTEIKEFDFKKSNKDFLDFKEKDYSSSGVADLVVKTILAKRERSKAVASEYINLLKLIRLTGTLEKDRDILRDESFILNDEDIDMLKKLWLKDYDNILKNYLLCSVFNKDFYYNITYGFMKLVISSALLKFKILLNIKYLKRALSEEELIYTIKSHDNDLVHDGEFFNEFYKKNEIDINEYNKKILTILY